MTIEKIKCYTVAETVADDDTFIQARWFGGAGVSVFVNGKEKDYITDFSIETVEDFVEAFAAYLLNIHENDGK